jgi:hypothetical protein
LLLPTNDSNCVSVPLTPDNICGDPMTDEAKISLLEFDDDGRKADRTPYLIGKCVIPALRPGGIVTTRPSTVLRAIEALKAAEGC